MALKLFGRRTSKNMAGSAAGEPLPGQSAKEQEFVPAQSEPLDSDPLKRLEQQERYNIILRDEQKWAQHEGGARILEAVKDILEQRMALVPAGSVTLYSTLTAQPGSDEQEIGVEPFLLDTYTVTNARYQRFVDAGGYDMLECWPEEIWPNLIELKDLTGQPAPRFWRNGRHNALLSNHPVVGVSWYEAQAYALWIGQRLPTESQWQMAASWHINSTADVMRRFPWGDAMDRTRCNLWSARHGRTVPIDEYPGGAAPNQVLQLVGNVWEWTAEEYEVTDDEGRPIVGEMPMHGVRGGAFDTYFDTQATSSFRTGQLALTRNHNTGFRCALDLSEASWMNGE